MSIPIGNFGGFVRLVFVWRSIGYVIFFHIVEGPEHYHVMISSSNYFGEGLIHSPVQYVSTDLFDGFKEKEDSRLLQIITLL